jgi:hypothetical protein
MTTFFTPASPFTVFGESHLLLDWLVEFSDTSDSEDTDPADYDDPYELPWEISYELVDAAPGVQVLNVTLGTNMNRFSLYSLTTMWYTNVFSVLVPSAPVSYAGRNMTANNAYISFNMINYPYHVETGKVSLWFGAYDAEVSTLINSTHLQYGTGSHFLTWLPGVNISKAGRNLPAMYGSTHFVVFPSYEGLSRNWTWSATLSMDIFAMTPTKPDNDTAIQQDSFRQNSTFKALLERFSYTAINSSKIQKQVMLIGNPRTPGNRNYLQVLYSSAWNGMRAIFRTASAASFVSNFDLGSLAVTNPTGARFSFRVDPNTELDSISSSVIRDNATNATLNTLTYMQIMSFYNLTARRYNPARNITLNITVCVASDSITVDNVSYAPNQVRLLISNTPPPVSLTGRSGNITYTLILGGSRQMLLNATMKRLLLESGDIAFTNATSGGVPVNFRVTTSAFDIWKDRNTFNFIFDGPAMNNSLVIDYTINMTKLASQESVDGIKRFVNPPSVTVSVSASASSAASSASADATSTNAAASTVTFSRSYPDRDLHDAYVKAGLSVSPVYDRQVTCDPTATSGFKCSSTAKLNSTFQTPRLYTSFSMERHPSFEVSYVRYDNVSGVNGTVVAFYHVDILGTVEYNATVPMETSPYKTDFTTLRPVENMTNKSVSSLDGKPVSEYRFSSSNEQVTVAGHVDVVQHSAQVRLFSVDKTTYAYQAMSEGLPFSLRVEYTPRLTLSNLAFVYSVYGQDIKNNVNTSLKSVVSLDDKGNQLIRYFDSRVSGSANQALVEVSRLTAPNQTLVPLEYKAKAVGLVLTTPITNGRENEPRTLYVSGEVSIDLFKLSAEAVLGTLVKSGAQVATQVRWTWLFFTALLTVSFSY